MWATVAAFLIPTAVTLYGLVVLISGEAGGFGTKSVRGPLARVFGILLAAALPLAIFLGPMVRITPVNPKGLGSILESRDAEILREILAEYKALEDWRTENEPDKNAPSKTVPQVDARIEAFAKFEAAYKERTARTHARTDEWQEELDRRHQEREARKAEAVERNRRQGAIWVGLGVLLVVWAAIWLVGRKPSPGDSGIGHA